MPDTADPSAADAHRVTREPLTLQIGPHRLGAEWVRPAGAAAGKAPIVFLHEGLGSIAQWTGRAPDGELIDFPARLARATGRDAFLYDRLGFGRSDPLPADRRPDYLYREAWDTLPRVLDAAGINRAVLFGHSDGASIALLFAARFPQRTVAVISEAAHVFIEEVTLEGIRKARAAYHAPNSKLKAAMVRYHGAKADMTFRNWADVWLSPAFTSFDMTAELPSIRCPVLAIQGDGDEYGTEAQPAAIAEGVGGPVETWLITHCGHIPHIQADERVLPRIHGFVEASGQPIDIKKTPFR